MPFVLFGLTLLGVALFHSRAMWIALAGLVAVFAYRLIFTEFDPAGHLLHEWRPLVNLLGLLVGFALLAAWFEESRIPQILPRFLPGGWRGPFALLCIVFVLSAFLDNIAAALIGGTIAATVYGDRVHVGFLAALTAAANAGGAGSVVGDTTTTMMWVRGVSPLCVMEATIASAAALIVFGLIAARQQAAHQHAARPSHAAITIDWTCVGIVALILALTIVANVLIDLPAAGVWAAIVIAWPLRRPAFDEIPAAAKGAAFLLALVLCASMMPVDELPPASWHTALALGFVSAVFDNIPLTKLCLDQGGYDWGVLAYAVGFGGSMLWFGSSAGVALAGKFPQAKSVARWLRDGWHLPLAYVVGFFTLLATLGWHPHELPK